jgi:hypothetical protein
LAAGNATLSPLAQDVKNPAPAAPLSFLTANTGRGMPGGVGSWFWHDTLSEVSYL